MTASTETPDTTHTSVPVSCDTCGEDLVFTVKWNDLEHRTWVLHCTYCGVQEDTQAQVRHHLWVNGNSIYVGSYWGPDE